MTEYKATFTVKTDEGSHKLEERLCDPKILLEDVLATMAQFPSQITYNTLEKKEGL